MVNVYDFGVQADGVTDDTAAHQAAQDYADSIGASVVLHNGTSLISSTIIQKVPTYGQGMQTTFFKAAASAWGMERNSGDVNTSSYKPMWQIGKKPTDAHTPREDLKLAGCTFTGNGTRPATRSADRTTMICDNDGIHVAHTCQNPLFESVRVQFCQNGWNCYNGTAHVNWIRCKTGNNWFGLWIDHNGSDYHMLQCIFTGNQFASVGIHGELAEVRAVSGFSSITGVDGFTAISSHFGYGPYAFYQKSGTTNNQLGMALIVLLSSDMEACGNAGMWLSANGAQSSHSISWEGAGSWTAPLGSGSAAAYQIQGDANHPVQDTFVKIPHILSGTAGVSDFTRANFPAGNSGYKVNIATIQGRLFMRDAYQYVNTNNKLRLVDPIYSPYIGTSPIAATSVATDPQTLATHSLPTTLANAPRALCEFSIPVTATTADSTVIFRISSGSTVLGSTSLSLPAGGSVASGIIQFAPSGAASLTFDVASGGSGNLAIAASLVKFTAGHAYGA